MWTVSLLTLVSCIIFCFFHLATASLVEKLVKRWAPLVFFSPGEMFYPSSVPDFLDKVLPIPFDEKAAHFSYDEQTGGLPKGVESEPWHLVTRDDVGTLLRNKSSFLYGQNPKLHSVPVYAMVTICEQPTNLTRDNTIAGHSGAFPFFHVTYWMFYPYNQGKAVCTVDMGRFGAWPIPKLNNFCYGAVKEFGNHVGDWEHIKLYFEGSLTPKKMYVSVHDVGAIYKYKEGQFVFEGRHIRKSIVQWPKFPARIKLSRPSHRPVLFAARGSHGLWAAPGAHRFVRIPRLYDITGFGVPWYTWKNLVILNSDSYTDKNWLQFRGRWGNPKTKCHPVSSLGVHICELSDGPTGIPKKKEYFKC